MSEGNQGGQTAPDGLQGSSHSNRPARREAQRSPGALKVPGHPVLRYQVNVGLPSGEAAEHHHIPLSETAMGASSSWDLDRRCFTRV